MSPSSSRLDERSPDRHRPGSGRHELGGGHRDGRPGPPRPRALARSRRPVGHVPPPDRDGEGGDRSGPRDRRPLHPRPRGRLVRARAHPDRDPVPADARTVRPLRIRRPHDQGAVLARGRDIGRCHPRRSVRAPGRRDERPADGPPGGPPIWLGGQKRRGIALAAEVADGWLLPAVLPDKSETNMDYFLDRRDALLRAMEAIGQVRADSPWLPRSRPGGPRRSAGSRWRWASSRGAAGRPT